MFGNHWRASLIMASCLLNTPLISP